MTPLILSLFPGIGLLDMAFEEEGFTVVRGPDVLWGGDVRRFHPPAGRFDGVIGGPPCQDFSPLGVMSASVAARRFGNLIPEFERVVAEATPEWFLAENVCQAPVPAVAGYPAHAVVLNPRWLGEVQSRRRRFTFGSRRGLRLHLDGVVALEAPDFAYTVTSAHAGQRHGKRIVHYSVADAARLQGLPEGFLSDAPFTERAKLKAIANGVPLPMGRAVARAVKRALDEEAVREELFPGGELELAADQTGTSVGSHNGT
jgi:DNA (cytosine-5)-methyltransferase 1